mgnify:CR=1 FL=1|jgi:hypothetical protein|tara:strand:- start:95201 stop:95521 length:321 start_codon:yes stop_codon:yes gene_type:complete
MKKNETIDDKIIEKVINEHKKIFDVIENTGIIILDKGYTTVRKNSIDFNIALLYNEPSKNTSINRDYVRLRKYFRSVSNDINETVWVSKTDLPNEVSIDLFFTVKI